MKMKRTIIRPNGVPNSISEQVATPIMPSVVYASQSPDALDEQYEGKQKGYTYAREGHPNAEILARFIDKLEGSCKFRNGCHFVSCYGYFVFGRPCFRRQPIIWSYIETDA